MVDVKSYLSGIIDVYNTDMGFRTESQKSLISFLTLSGNITQINQVLDLASSLKFRFTDIVSALGWSYLKSEVANIKQNLIDIVNLQKVESQKQLDLFNQKKSLLFQLIPYTSERGASSTFAVAQASGIQFYNWNESIEIFTNKINTLKSSPAFVTAQIKEIKAETKLAQEEHKEAIIKPLEVISLIASAGVLSGLVGVGGVGALTLPSIITPLLPAITIPSVGNLADKIINKVKESKPSLPATVITGQNQIITSGKVKRVTMYQHFILGL